MAFGFVRFALLFAPIFLLRSAGPDRLSDLVKQMGKLAAAGDQEALGPLAPMVIAELAMPHPEAALGWNQLGIYYTTQGNLIEAERALRHGIRILEAEGGRHDDDMSLLLLNLGALYLQSGWRPAQAELLLHRGLKLTSESPGPHSPDAADFIYRLGETRLHLGDRRGARQYFERALATASGDGNGDKRRRSFILSGLAVAFALDKQWTAARDAMVQCIDSLVAVMGDSHPDLIGPYLNLARTYQRLGQFGLASANLDRARAIAEARLVPDHWLMIEIFASMGDTLRKTGHAREARDLYRRAKLIAKKQSRDPAAESWIHVGDLRRQSRRR